jgi:hypothetical protein
MRMALFWNMLIVEKDGGDLLVRSVKNEVLHKVDGGKNTSHTVKGRKATSCIGTAFYNTS